MELLRARIDLQLHHRTRYGPIWRRARRAARRDGTRIQHPVALSAKASIYRCLRGEALLQKGRGGDPGQAPKASVGQGSCRVRGQKTTRVDAMVVAVAVRLGVVRLSGMRWRATTLMPLDPHDHGATSELRFRSVASGTALERELRVEKPSAVHPQCEAVLECGS